MPRITEYINLYEIFCTTMYKILLHLHYDHKDVWFVFFLWSSLCLVGRTWLKRTGAWSKGCAGTSPSHSWEWKELLEIPLVGFFSKHSSLVLHGDELFWGENGVVALSDVKAPEISSNLFQHQQHVSIQDTDILVIWYYGNTWKFWSVLIMKESVGFCTSSTQRRQIVTCFLFTTLGMTWWGVEII